VIYAFSIYGVPQAPQRHFFSAFPSGFYAAFGVKTMQKYKIFFYPQLFCAIFLEKKVPLE
jgi:hypothetical protein